MTVQIQNPPEALITTLAKYLWKSTSMKWPWPKMCLKLNYCVLKETQDDKNRSPFPDPWPNINVERQRSHHRLTVGCNIKRASDLRLTNGSGSTIYNGVKVSLQRCSALGQVHIRLSINNDVFYCILKTLRGKPKVVHCIQLTPYAGAHKEDRVAQMQTIPSIINFILDYSNCHKAPFRVRREEHQYLFSTETSKIEAATDCQETSQGSHDKSLLWTRPT